MKNPVLRGVGIGLGVTAGVVLWPFALVGVAAALVAKAFEAQPEPQPEPQPVLEPQVFSNQLAAVRREAMAKVHARNLQHQYEARLERLEKAWAASGDYPQASA